MQTLSDLFATFEALGTKTAFVNRTGVRRLSVSYCEFDDYARRMAHLLKKQGVNAGDRVLIWGPNSSWWAIAWWGIIIRGAIAVPVDFMSDLARADAIRTLTKAKCLLQSRFKAERMTADCSMLLEELPWQLEAIRPIAELASPLVDDTVQIIYTSGTTGNPKGVMLSHANLMANIRQINEQVPIIDSSFNLLSLLPLSHMFELMGGFLVPLYHGAAVVYLRTLKPSAIMEALKEEDIHLLMSVPRLMQLLQTAVERELEKKQCAGLFRLLRQLAEKLPQNLRKVLFFPVQLKFGRHFKAFISGGAPLDPEIFRFWATMGFMVLEGYGLTETSPVLCSNTLQRQVAGSVGQPLPGVQLKIENKEIMVRGDNVFSGYYRNEQASRGAFTEDGWFRTGDLGEIGTDGWLVIKGREKELIVTASGINVYPDELETVLNRIAGVKESCVIGVKRGGGEEVHAVLILDESGKAPEEIVTKANRGLDALNRISGYSIWGEPEFPRTDTLKIKKFEVRERLKKGVTSATIAASQDKLLNLLAKITGTACEQIHEESLLVADLGLTSIDRMELVTVLEQEYRLDIDDTQAGLQTTVSDLRSMVKKQEQVTHHDHFRFWTNNRFFSGMRRVWDRLCHGPLFRCFVTLKVQGVENLAALNGPVFFVANHLSYLDQLAVMFALPAKIRSRTATAAWEEFFFGEYRGVERIWRFMSYQYASVLFNLFPLPQSKGFGGSLAFMGKLADAGINILLFPEGGHSRDSTLQPFQPGLGVMVKEVGIAMVPVKISGTDQVLPHEARFPRPGQVTVTFGEPLRFSFEEPAEIVEMAQRAVERL